jgi:hypothetical protein
MTLMLHHVEFWAGAILGFVSGAVLMWLLVIVEFLRQERRYRIRKEPAGVQR